MSDNDETSDDVERAVEGVGDGVETAGKLAGLAQKASEGDAAGPLQAGLGAAGGASALVGGALGEEEGDAREALRTAGAVAGAASSLVGLGSSLAGGDVGAATGALGGAAGAARNIVPDNEVASVLGGVSQGSAAAQQAASQLGSLSQGMSGPGGGHDDVEPHLEVSGADSVWRVRSFTINEALNTIPTATVQAHYDTVIEVAELMHADCSLFLERRQSELARAFKGVALHATVQPARESVGGVEVTLRFSPAAALLGFRVDSRIHQEVTVVEAIEATFDDLLGLMGRSLRADDLTRTYEAREYLVQYQESHLHFIRRLCEEEGISFFFEYDDDHEVMVLADTVESFAAAREDDEGEVEYHANPGGEERGNEYARDLHHYEEVGATDAVVADYDWSNPSLVIRAEKTGRGEHEPALEIYDHTDAQIFHEYGGGQYGNNTAKVQARLRAERLDLRRQRWQMTSNVVTALPGRTLTVSGHPETSLDQRYAVVASSAHGSSISEGGRSTFSVQHRLVPASMPFRPPRTTTPPLIHGPLLATVVGPSGEEIHTDEHGRVRVYFAWDRYHEASADDASCWMRVTQRWAGPGFGTFFLPRIGMEVLVSFMGGNPDRPLITGCVYNGANRAGVELDAKKTQSLIRTKSSPNSEGFNEMRFEDEAGNEFIYVHAQKDYNEDVLNNHATHVFNNQSNTVDSNQTETIGVDQTMTVHGERTKTVDKDETNTVHQNRETTIDIDDTEKVGGDRTLSVTGHEKVTVNETRTLHVLKQTTEMHDDGRKVAIKTYDRLDVTEGANRDVHVTGAHNIKVDGDYSLMQGDTEIIVQSSPATHIESAGLVQIKVGPSQILVKSSGVVTIMTSTELGLQVGDSKLQMSPGAISLEASEIQLRAGDSVLKLEASKATLKGAMLDLLGDMFTTIKGTLVRIN